LIGAVGDDQTGRAVLAELRDEGIDVGLVRRCGSVETGQIVHLVESGGRRRYVEHVGANSRLRLSAQEMRQQCTADTVAVISTALERAPVVAAVRGARLAGVTTVVDRAGEPGTAQAVLDSADLVRGDSA
jgi:ribokinase